MSGVWREFRFRLSGWRILVYELGVSIFLGSLSVAITLITGWPFLWVLVAVMVGGLVVSLFTIGALARRRRRPPGAERRE